MRVAIPDLISEPSISSAIAAVEEATPVPIDPGPVAVRETVRSWLVFFARLGDKQPAYCLKVRKPAGCIPMIHRRSEELCTAAEYEMNVRVHRHFSQVPAFSNSVVSPVAVLPDHDAILTEYAAGRPLKEKLPWRANILTSRWNLSSLMRISRMCGAWLRWLHDMSPPDALPVYCIDTEEFERRALGAIANLPETLSRYLPVEMILECIQEVRAHPSQSAVCHGDFHPGNILVSGSRITVTDVGTAGVRIPEDDLAFFVALMFSQPGRLVFGPLAGKPQFVRRLCDAFLAAYGFPTADGWQRLRPMMAMHVVERLARVSVTIEGLPRRAQPLLWHRLASWVTSELPLLLNTKGTS